MKTLSLLLFLLLVFSNSCKKDELHLSVTDYMIFGHFYGECKGEACIEIFRLEQNQLLEDTKDQYPNSTDFYEGKYYQLPAQKYEDVKDILTFFPKDLLNEPNRVIGQPDAGDWGGLYIEYNVNGLRKFWLIDQMKNNVPAKYHAFIVKVNEKIAMLQ